MKTCANCGRGNADGAVFCQGCGATLEQAKAAGAAAGAVQAYSNPAAGAVQAGAAEQNKALVWLILNIAATLLCCCANLFGILGIIFAAVGMSSYKKGNYEDMRKKSKLAMIMFIIAAVGLVIGWVAVFLSSFILPVLVAMIPALASIPFIANGDFDFDFDFDDFEYFD